MKDLAFLVSTFTELNEHLASQMSAAAADGDLVAVDRLERKQRLNEQAYFLICWGQLESEIDQACRSVIRARQADRKWERRRAFDIYNPNDRRLSGLAFEDRVAFVLDKQAGRGSPWARVLRNYSLRNQIAHGTLMSDRIDIAAVVSDFYLIQSALSR